MRVPILIAALALTLAGAAYAQAPAPQVVMLDAEKIVLLLRTTLLTLNDAIQTGNFTVLRDRGAPGFLVTPTARRDCLKPSPILPPGTSIFPR